MIKRTIANGTQSTKSKPYASPASRLGTIAKTRAENKENEPIQAVNASTRHHGANHSTKNAPDALLQKMRKYIVTNASNAKKPHLATNPHASPPSSRSTLPSQQLRPQISGSKHSHNHSGTTTGENKKPPSVSRGSASRNANTLH